MERKSIARTPEFVDPVALAGRVPLLLAAATAAAVTVVVDQGGKALVRDGMRVCSEPPVALCDRIDLLGPLGVLRTTNDDGALGILGAGSLAVVAILAFVAIALVARRSGWSRTLAVGVGLLIGGATSNLVDRIEYGTVTDFIDIRAGGADLGLVINPADIALVLGGVLFWAAATRRTAARRTTATALQGGLA